MAQNLQSLKKRIKTAQNISQIARAMEMIAASKIKKAQAAGRRSRDQAALERQKIQAETERALAAKPELRKTPRPSVDPAPISGRREPAAP